MSDSETSQDVCGHHETWDDVMEAQAKKIQNLERDLLLANKRLEHALWHCYIYRHSLSKVPGGYDQHKQSLAEHEEKLKEGPLCAQCERDALLKRIAVLEERLKSSTLGNGENETEL